MTTAPALAPTDITVTADRLGREVVVIPDDVARRMRDEIYTDWTEVGDVGYGSSGPFRPGCWMHDTTSALIAVYAASPIPPGVPVEEARRERELATAIGQMVVSIIGESQWDAGQRWWTAPYDPELRVPGTPHRVSADTYRYGG